MLKCFALSVQIVDVPEDWFLFSPRLIDDLHITSLFIIDHLRLYVVEESSLSLHPDQVDLAIELHFDCLTLSVAVAEATTTLSDYTVELVHLV